MESEPKVWQVKPAGTVGRQGGDHHDARRVVAHHFLAVRAVEGDHALTLPVGPERT